MAHEVVPSPHRNLAHLRIFDDLLPSDMTCDAELGLGSDRPVYILVDIAQLESRMPDDFFEVAQRGFLVHPDTRHMALVIRSALLRSIALMTIRPMGHMHRVSLHDTVAEAETHLIGLIRREGL
jgi:hypothetical protein